MQVQVVNTTLTRFKKPVDQILLLTLGHLKIYLVNLE